MTIRQFAWGCAAAALAFGAAPAFAFTHHPATPAEIQQTDALNAQALAAAQGGTASANGGSSTSATCSDVGKGNSPASTDATPDNADMAKPTSTDTPMKTDTPPPAQTPPPPPSSGQ